MTLNNIGVLWPGLAVGAIPLAFGAWQIRREFQPRKWAKVPGWILSSRIDVTQAVQGEVFAPVVEYEFRFDNQSFKSRQRRIRHYDSGQRADAEAIVARYQAGSDVTVFVHPEKPEKSVLEYGVSPLSWVPLGLGLGFILLTMLAIFTR